ncbi:Oidioi.mRNA.OKI2018_I69.chr2.g4252.t1.cds [Oikopleura dioica]|uniref:Oidioi.mRNA.OKI2018_I69.chr2.g4252.t1.cds n=1 Tax=Oikopleura dioica TaxID=34765 RepID=A0ABN7T3C6_OIKDI|nr:Oidioi.mRNA.OKI2018_I69.chr2.g4252.t1.cds [Oikopleura dioica]
MKLLRCLHRNFAASVENGAKGADPAERARFLGNEINEERELPSAEDLGEFIKEMAMSVRQYSDLLARLSDSLKSDEKIAAKGNDEYRDFRRLLQNSIDSAKFLSPELEIISKFVIPLSGDNIGSIKLQKTSDENENEKVEEIKCEFSDSV